MEIEGWIEEFIGDTIPTWALFTPLPDELAARVIERLKQEADRYWYIDPRHSLEFADRIVTIAEQRCDASQTALGLMARGDALRFLGRMADAWQTLTLAGNIFQIAGDEVGWARTRIGHLYLAVKLNYVAEALADADYAQAILSRCDEPELLVRLHMALATVYTNLGEERKALELFRSTLRIAENLGKAGEQYLGNLRPSVPVETFATMMDAPAWAGCRASAGSVQSLIVRRGAQRWQEYTSLTKIG